MSFSGRKRFWKTAHVTDGVAGFGVLLDDRPLRTPAKAPLEVPSRALAAAIAEEWQAQGESIAPEKLPFTRAVNTAIDRVSPDPDPVVDAIAEYGETDLLCYRSDGPFALQKRQAEAWDPWLDWSARTLSAPLIAVTGIMHHAQPTASLGALRAGISSHDPFALVALHDLVSLSGSLILGLAVSRGALPPDEAWSLSRLDEAWQTAQWGIDAEAEAASARREAGFRRAAILLDLLAAEPAIR
jgi:chaperone required for assembly of F1-ATPase